MQDTRQSLKISLAFLVENQRSATIVEYIAKKYDLDMNPQKTLAQNAQSLVDHLMQYTGDLADGSSDEKSEYGREMDQRGKERDQEAS